MRKTYHLLSLVALIIIANSCNLKSDLKTNIENPIILVSGYGSKSTIWENTGFVGFMEQNRLVYGGRVQVDKNNTANALIDKKVTSENIDFFCLHYSDSTDNIGLLSVELGDAIDYILNYTHAKKVMLIGYSMGGVVCRDYLVNNLNNHRVETLITISSPHQGSFLANIAASSSSFFDRMTKDIILDQISSRMGIAIDGKAINNLLLEEDNNFLNQLNSMPHPLDISYLSIIGVSDVTAELNTYLKTFNLTVYEGDFVCSSKSQNMINIAWFKSNTPKSLVSKDIYGVHHLNILEHHQAIYNAISKYIDPISK